MNQKGFSPSLIIIGIVLLLVVIGGIFYLGVSTGRKIESGQQLVNTVNQIPQSSTKASPANLQTPDETTNWKTYTSSGIDSGLTFKYSNDWKENRFEVHKYTTQLYEGYTNSQWFNKINNLKKGESYSDQREKRTKLDSGSITTGEQYVIFKDEPSETAQGESYSFIKAYIIKTNTIYQVTLNYTGTDMSAYSKKVIDEATVIFKEAISTATLD